MSKTLALGYVFCIAVLAAMISLARGAIPWLDGFSAFFYVSLVGLCMFIAAVLCFRGAATSQGSNRKILAYIVSALSLFIGLGSAVAVILVAIGLAKPG